MAVASVRDLRYRFRELEERLRQGEEIEIRRRKQVVAKLVPVRPAKKKPLPDFAARRKAIFGDRQIDMQAILQEDRNGRW